MKFRVLNEYAAMEYKEDTSHIIISICSPHGKPIRLPENKNRKGYLFLNFHDLDHLPEADKICLGVGKPYKLFTDFQADLIWSFVDEHLVLPTVNMIICNCEAGISRSAGVIAGIKAGLGLDDSDIFENFLPNSLVYRKLLERREGKMLFQVDGKTVNMDEGIPRRFRKVVRIPGKLVNFITRSNPTAFAPNGYLPKDKNETPQ